MNVSALSSFQAKENSSISLFSRQSPGNRCNKKTIASYTCNIINRAITCTYVCTYVHVHYYRWQLARAMHCTHKHWKSATTASNTVCGDAIAIYNAPTSALKLPLKHITTWALAWGMTWLPKGTRDGFLLAIEWLAFNHSKPSRNVPKTITHSKPRGILQPMPQALQKCECTDSNKVEMAD